MLNPKYSAFVTTAHLLSAVDTSMSTVPPTSIRSQDSCVSSTVTSECAGVSLSPSLSASNQGEDLRSHRLGVGVAGEQIFKCLPESHLLTMLIPYLDLSNISYIPWNIFKRNGLFLDLV